MFTAVEPRGDHGNLQDRWSERVKEQVHVNRQRRQKSGAHHAGSGVVSNKRVLQHLQHHEDQPTDGQLFYLHVHIPVSCPDSHVTCSNNSKSS